MDYRQKAAAPQKLEGVAEVGERSVEGVGGNNSSSSSSCTIRLLFGCLSNFYGHTPKPSWLGRWLCEYLRQSDLCSPKGLENTFNEVKG